MPAWHTSRVGLMAATRRGERAAALAAGLVWLLQLLFPVIFVAAAAPPRGTVAYAAVLLGVLLVAYVRAVWLIAREGAPRLFPVELAIVAVVAVALPLAFGGRWFGATVFLSALAGLSWPASRALLAVAAASLLAAATGLPSAVPQPQLASVLLLTPLAGVVVVVVVRQMVLGRELSRLSAKAERLRLARELHDSVKQHAFIAAMELGAARGLPGAADAHLKEHLDAAAGAVGQVQRRLSGVLDELRPAPGELVPALRRLAAGFSRRTGLPVHLEIAGEDDTPAEPLLPVAAEALTNIERHAAASHVTVTWRPGELVVCDDGMGFDTSGTAGHGLAGMRERLAACGGTIEVTSGPSGTTVCARCPR